MKKLSPKDLRIGMYVEKLDRPWLESPYMLEGVWITSDEDIEELTKHCEHVYISEEKGKDMDMLGNRLPLLHPRPNNPAQPTAQRARSTITEIEFSRQTLPPPRTGEDPSTINKGPIIQFEEEISTAREIHSKAYEVVNNMYEDVRMGKSIDALGAKAVVENMVGSIVRNPNAQVWLTHLKNKDEYTAIHSLNVCIFSLAFGRHLGISGEALNELGLGALLHDLGKIRVPTDVLNKPDKLTKSEFSLMKKHPVHGRDILSTTKGLSSKIIDIAHSHHERMNGSGYPLGVDAKEISFFGRVVAIVDIYDAITSQRVYHHGMHSVDAMTQLYTMRQGILDQNLVDQFIQCLGIYPVGSIVELYSGEIGIVLEINHHQRLRPKVLLVLDANKRRYTPPRIVNLAQFELSSYDTEYDIIRVLTPGTYGIDIRDYIQSGVLSR